MTSTSASADFHNSFQADKRAILCLFEAEQPSSADISTHLQSLRARLNENLAFLPAYDRRSYDLQLKELEARLSQLRAKDKPKSRFAFSARPKASTSAPAAPSTSLSSTSPPISTPPTCSAANTAATPVYFVSDKHNQVIRAPSDVKDGYTISLTSLSSCIIDLRPTATGGDGAKMPQPTSLHAKGLRRCVLVVLVMEGSAIMEGLEDCLVILGAQQFRIHSSQRTTVLLHVPSTPIIEHSSGLTFGSYPTFLNPPAVKSTHDQVQDFDWIREGQSPNWSLLSNAEAEAKFGARDAEIIAKLDSGDAEDLEDVLGRLLGTSEPVALQPDAS